MKTVLKTLFIFAFAATVSSCDFFGDKHDKPVDEKPTTVIPEDSAAGDAKIEEKKEGDSLVAPKDSSKEVETKKEEK